MAKKSKASPAKAPPSAPANVEPEVAKRIVELKTEGNNSFARGDYQKALTIYDDAIKLLPSNAPEKADFHNNKAACYIGQKRYKEAVKECTSALEVAPNSVRALQRRAKAFEQQGLHKQALADIVTINKTDNSSPETQEQERRLREAAARRPGSAINGGGSTSAAAPGAAVARASGAGSASAASGASKLSALSQGLFVAKCTLGDDTKLVHLSMNNNYADVLSAVQAKFPNAGPFALKYLDKNGDLVTLTCKADIHVALAELMQQYQRTVAAQGAHGPKLASFPPLRLHLAPVASAADVPKPPPEEEFERNQLLNLQRAHQAAGGKDGASASAAAGPAEELHLDSWLVDFAHLFIQQTGLEPDKHVDLHNMGWDSVTKGMDTTIHAEAAVPLFDKAKDSFRDVACTGLSSWGQVHQLLGQRALEAAARAGKALDEVRSAVLAEFAEAEKRYREALAYNADFFDGVCNMSQLEFERCKLTAGLMAADTKSSAESSSEASTSDGAAPAKTQEQAAAEAQEALTAATRAALATLKADDVHAAKSGFETALEWADKAVALAPAMDARQKELQAKAAETGQAAPTAQPAGEYDFRAQALVLKGNFIYEWSQMLAAVGGEWRPELDRAVALFREAGCPEKDIRVALRNHLKAAELDIPADEPEPAKEEAAAAAAAAAAPAKPKEEAKPEATAEEKPKAKGLPSLEVKKAKK